MAAVNKIRIQPEPTANANAGTSAVAAELAAWAAARPAEAVCAADGAAHAASMWAEVGMIHGLTATQTSGAYAATASDVGRVAATNEQALTLMLITNADNTRALTSHPSGCVV